MTNRQEPTFKRSPFRPQRSPIPSQMTAIAAGRLYEEDDDTEPPYKHRSSTLVDVFRILAAGCFLLAVVMLFQKILIAAAWMAGAGLGLVGWAAIIDAIQEIRGIARRFNQNN